MRYRFGAARLDVVSRQLLRDGVEQPLTPKAYDLLRLLIECRPRVLTKPEIMDLIWPDAFVAEANIGILIGDLRAAIGDTAARPTLIKTHHGVGYSFCGEVTEQQRTDNVPVGGTLFLLALGDRRIVLGQGELVVGREIQCEVIIPDPSVSRRHARLTVTPSRLEIEDLQSKNGTRVNGQAIRDVTLVPNGAAVTFGTITGTVHRMDADGKSTLTVNT